MVDTAVARWARRLCVLLTLPLIGGCANFGYYLQSMQGQFSIWRQQRPISSVMADPQTPPRLRHKLAEVVQIRKFASRELHEPDNGSYHAYVDLHRPFVVWNVFAAPRLSIEPIKWCFAFIGCVDYRGYFSRADAEKFAAGLDAQGDDVFVGGVPAYSTLGWFDDPVLSTFIRYPETEVAGLIFHELAHQMVYVRDDSMFNESWAVTVQLEGVKRWLATQDDPRRRTQFEHARGFRNAFTRLVTTCRERLKVLYASDASDTVKLQRKAEIFQALDHDYRALKAQWGFNGYDPWAGQRVNNATLASVAIYTRFVPAFQALLKQKHGNLPAFYAAVKKLAALPKEQRTRRLEALMPGQSG
jgi:predicted aminopeptidase